MYFQEVQICTSRKYRYVLPGGTDMYIQEVQICTSRKYRYVLDCCNEMKSLPFCYNYYDIVHVAVNTMMMMMIIIIIICHEF